ESIDSDRVPVYNPATSVCEDNGLGFASSKPCLRRRPPNRSTVMRIESGYTRRAVVVSAIISLCAMVPVFGQTRQQPPPRFPASTASDPAQNIIVETDQ